MKDKLTISDLSPYLPYGLKVFRDCTNSLLYNDAVVEMDCIGYIDKVVTFKTGADYYFDDDEIDFTIQPLLSPLSDLLNIDWISIFQAGFDALKKPIPEKFFGTYFLEVTDNSAELMINENDSVEYCFEEKSFVTTGFRFDQLAAFNKIYELHGDINNLIERGLALNKLTYKPQP